MLTSVFLVFTLCYISRTIYDFTIPTDLKFGDVLSGVCLPVLWDGLPISLMFTYHFLNLRLLKKTKKQLKGSSIRQYITTAA